MSSNLETTARALVADGRGILAADESTGTIEKRFRSIGVASTEEMRRAYREMLFTAPGLGKFISGVILFDETIRQKTADGESFVAALERQGIFPGIKVDKGAKALSGFPGEKITEGLDGLRERFAEYAKLGARFSKWRAVITIGADIPSRTCIDANAHALARFAALSQEAGLVPIVEPEVLMDGDHTIERCFEVTGKMLQRVFHRLFEHRVRLEGMLLKPNMMIAGEKCPQQASIAQVAEATLRCLKEFVPPAVPGIVFLSGGQSETLATENLNAINQAGKSPWKLSFSYGRALQASAMKAWSGKRENIGAAQKVLLHRARCNSAACQDNYSTALEAEQK
jgi:fructose-bisphosphate aldolase class I